MPFVHPAAIPFVYTIYVYVCRWRCENHLCHISSVRWNWMTKAHFLFCLRWCYTALWWHMKYGRQFVFALHTQRVKYLIYLYYTSSLKFMLDSSRSLCFTHWDEMNSSKRNCCFPVDNFWHEITEIRTRFANLWERNFNLLHTCWKQAKMIFALQFRLWHLFYFLDILTYAPLVLVDSYANWFSDLLLKCILPS